MVDQERREQHEQIGDGEYKQSLSGSAIGLDTPAQADREQNEGRSTDGGDRAIYSACKPDRPWQLRGESQQAAVDQDLPRRRSTSRDNRQHRHACTRVVTGAVERQGPEMRRGPQEDDEEERKRFEPYVSGRRGPSDHGR